MIDPADRLVRETEAMQDILILYPADLIELIAFVDADDTATGRGTCEPCPTFKDSE